MKPEQFKKQYVKVLDSTLMKSRIAIEMIGSICEVNDIIFDDKTIRLTNKDKNTYAWFKFSDVTPAFPDFTIDGKVLCVGDRIKNQHGGEYEVYGECFYNGEYMLQIVRIKKGKPDWEYICDLYRKEYLIKFSLISQVGTKKEVEELTMEQICKELGREIKIKK